jgi:hypothetical protein
MPYQVWEWEPQVSHQEAQALDQEAQALDQEAQALDQEAQALEQVPQALHQDHSWDLVLKENVSIARASSPCFLFMFTILYACFIKMFVLFKNFLYKGEHFFDKSPCDFRI